MKVLQLISNQDAKSSNVKKSKDQSLDKKPCCWCLLADIRWLHARNFEFTGVSGSQHTLER